MSKLIILRGPSGAGKSTIARQVRERANSKIAVVKQDYIRRIILHEKDIQGGNNIDLIARIVIFALDNGYNVILEGILYSGHYQTMLEELLEHRSQENYLYYLDVSFEETLKRHITRDKKDEFGKHEMKKWYKDKDFFHEREQAIPESYTLEEIVEHILRETGLDAASPGVSKLLEDYE